MTILYRCQLLWPKPGSTDTYTDLDTDTDTNIGHNICEKMRTRVQTWQGHGKIDKYKYTFNYQHNNLTKKIHKKKSIGNV